MVASNNSLSFVSDDGKGYNLCHFWSSEYCWNWVSNDIILTTLWSDFEIVDLSFVQSEAYRSYFEALDGYGGFFMERWGDAPIRSIAASLLLHRDEIWHIDYAGYVSILLVTTTCEMTLLTFLVIIM